MGLSKTLLTILVLEIFTIVAYSASAGGRHLLAEDDISANLQQAGDDLNNFMDSIWGGKCFTDDQCAATVAYCAKDDGFSLGAVVGQCRPTWWIWVVVGVLILLFLSACACCVCLCSCCSCILDVLCCCCRNKGYSPAGTG